MCVTNLIVLQRFVGESDQSYIQHTSTNVTFNHVKMVSDINL